MRRAVHSALLVPLAILAGCHGATAPETGGAHALIRGQVLLAGNVPMSDRDLTVSCAPELNWWIVSMVNTDASGHFTRMFHVTGEAAAAVRRSDYTIDCHFHAPATDPAALLDVTRHVRFGPDDQSPPTTDVVLRQNIPSN